MLYGGGVQRAIDKDEFTINFSQIPITIERIVVALTIEQGLHHGQSFSQLQQIESRILDLKSGKCLSVFPLSTSMMLETALIVGEFYSRNKEWKFRAVGQGFVGGFRRLADEYGVDLDNTVMTAPAELEVSTPSHLLQLKKITLDKRNPSISLDKKVCGFGEIVANLNWHQRKDSSGKGFFGRLLQSSRKVDLDLGCLFKLRNGQSGVVQALGNAFGSLSIHPYIQLMSDDRSGASADGEFLHINGQYWNELDRVVLFAMIYEGAPNWSETDAVVTLQIPERPVLEICIDSHHNDQRICALAILENQDGNLRVTKLVKYFQDHRYLDQAYGFGLRWVAGSKN
jgi:tellurite resistance protein TerA